MYLKIESSESVFTLINTFHTTTENQHAIVESLSRFSKIAWHWEGFVGAACHASEDGLRVVNYVQWKTRENLGNMLARPESKVHLQEVSALASIIEPVFYQVRFVESLAED